MLPPVAPLADLMKPPLQYFLHVLRAKEWNTVTILTAAKRDSFLNPTYHMLEMMSNAGALGKNIRLYKVREALKLGAENNDH